jgi:hypothetical protein
VRVKKPGFLKNTFANMKNAFSGLVGDGANVRSGFCSGCSGWLMPGKQGSLATRNLRNRVFAKNPVSGGEVIPFSKSHATIA